MVSTPNSMEALKVMTDYLDEAKKGTPLDPSVYFGCAAICSGLMAVVYELRTMRAALETKRAA